MARTLLERALRGKGHGRSLALVGIVTGTLVLVAVVQLWCALQAILDNPGQTGDYLCLRREQGLLGGLSRDAAFSAVDVARFARMPGVEGAIAVRRSRPAVVASLAMPGRTFSSMLFVESIPDTWLDTPWGPNQSGQGGPADPVPILVGRNFLFLYNASLAPANGLPQLHPDLLAIMPLELEFRGKDAWRRVHARIVGTTDRLDSFLVPDTFLAGINQDLEGWDLTGGDKLLLKLGASARGAVQEQARIEGLEIAGPLAGMDGIFRLAAMLATSLGLLGALILALALSQFVLALRLSLLEQKSVHATLMLWGHHPAAIAGLEARRVTIALVAALNVAIALSLTIHGLFLANGADPGYPALLAGLLAAVTCPAIGMILALGQIRRAVLPKA